MYRQVELKREALYKMVWERPVLAVAKEIGISDVALAKACRRAGIPLPSRGHWAIIKAGRAIKTPPLPTRNAGQPAVLHFSVLENPPPKARIVDAPAEPPVEVPTQLNKPHPLVADLKAAAKGKKEDKGVLPLNYHKVLRVRTSTSQLQRALFLLDTLIKQFQERGYKVRISEEREETELVLKEGVISFRLDERTKQTPPPPPPPRPAGRRGEHYYEPWRPAYILVGTGDLTLEFGKYRLRDCRHVWKDRASKPLEAQLHEIMAALPSWEAVLRTRRLEEEERAANAQEAEKRRIAAARLDAIERQQRSRLVNNLRSWEHAERLRNFLAAAEPTASESIEGRQWLEWAQEQVRLLDPIQSDAAKVIDLEVKLDSYFTGYSQWNKAEKNWWD